MHLLFNLHLNKLLLPQLIKKLGLTTQPTEGSGLLLLDRTDGDGTDVGDNLIGEDETLGGESILLENAADTGDPSYLINEEYIVGDQSTDKVNQNELFEQLDDEILDFSESNPFGDAGEPS